MRDVAAELGLEVTVEDAGGASLVTAAITHVGLGTPERAAGAHVRLPHVGRASTTAAGCRLAPTAGSGRRPGRASAIDVDLEALGEPVPRRLGVA